jgi:hypothetical protein
MRVGHNPARFVEKVPQPAGITVTVVNCVPFLGGYFEQSLDVLKVVVESLHTTREPEHPYDVMVFDNHSCAEVRHYLQDASDQGKIQYLVLSDTNIGKIGAWNYMFGAAQGEYVVFSDGDVEFRPGWLSASLDVFNTFPNVGMVTARPLRGPIEFSSATLEWVKKQGIALEHGSLIDINTNIEHGLSIGLSEDLIRANHPTENDYRLTLNGKVSYIGSAHFQFMARRDTLRRIIPLPSEQPMRGERALDNKINEMGLLRLTTDRPLVRHLGNRIIGGSSPATRKRTTLFQRILWFPAVRRPLLWLNNRIFRLYFLNVK